MQHIGVLLLFQAITIGYIFSMPYEAEREGSTNHNSGLHKRSATGGDCRLEKVNITLADKGSQFDRFSVTRVIQVRKCQGGCFGKFTSLSLLKSIKVSEFIDQLGRSSSTRLAPTKVNQALLTPWHNGKYTNMY